MTPNCTGRCLKLMTVSIVLTCVVNMFFYRSAPRGMDIKHANSSREITTGAVASDHPVCSEIGREILVEGGSAVDAAIATLLCCGIHHPHSAGLGGRATFTIYDPKLRKTIIIAGKTVAPANVNISQMLYIKSIYHTGALSIGVPGEVQGYWEAHQRYGKLPWKRVLQPTIDILESGVPLSKDANRKLEYMIDALKVKKNMDLVKTYPDLSSIFCNKDGSVKKEGEIIHRPQLLKTLKKIAEHGADYLYKGEGADLLVADIKEQGGVITTSDLEKIKAEVVEEKPHKYKDFTLVTPGGYHYGLAVAFLLRVLDGYNLTRDSFKKENIVKTYHILAEVFRHTSGHCDFIGDVDYTKEKPQFYKDLRSEEYAKTIRAKILPGRTFDKFYYKYNSTNSDIVKGTTHVSVLAPDGSAVSVTSSINNYYGSMIYSRSTGIILNNCMMSFFIRNRRNNGFAAGKSPLSGKSPSLVFDNKGNLRLIIGSSGGNRIATTLGLVIARIMWFNHSLQEAIRTERLHFDVGKNKLLYEVGFPQNILDELQKFGYKLELRDRYMSNVQAIYINPATNQIEAFSDERKSGRACLLRQSV